MPAVKPVGAGVIVKGAVPPLGVMMTEPVAPPLQATLVTAVVAVMTVGSVIVTGTVMEQPFASVTVNVWLPAVKPVCAGVIVNGAVPPAGVMITEPVAPPLQATLVMAVVAVRATG